MISYITNSIYSHGAISRGVVSFLLASFSLQLQEVAALSERLVLCMMFFPVLHLPMKVMREKGYI